MNDAASIHQSESDPYEECAAWLEENGFKRDLENLGEGHGSERLTEEIELFFNENFAALLQVVDDTSGQRQ